ncbi:MAG: DNA-3-methyladenine glycosylase family protein [Solirubrobacteraceae bacterium]
MVAQGLEHLRAVDPVMASLIAQHGPNGLMERREGHQTDHYGALVRSIVGQQLSTKAAAAIYRRLADRFGGRAPTPQEVLADDPTQLRAQTGLSRAKVSFLRSLAEKVTDGSLDLARLERLPDDEVISELVAVRGIGTWSAHMFLMFHLRRPDVLAVGDLGIRRSMKLCYQLAALPSPAEMEVIADPWRPYRTLACDYLWRALDNEPL